MKKLNRIHSLVTRVSRCGCAGCDEPAAVRSGCFQGKLKGPKVHRDSALCLQLLCKPEILPIPKVDLTTILAYEKFLPRHLCV